MKENKVFDIAINGEEQKLFGELLLNASKSNDGTPVYDNLPDEYKKIISEYEFKILTEKLFDVEKPVLKYTKIFMIVDYINAFTSGSLGSEMARSIDKNIHNRLINALNNESTAVVVLIDSHYNDEAYMKTREGRHLPVLHANTDEERMIYGTVGEELKGYYNSESNFYDTDENAGVFFIYKSEFGSLEAPHVMNYEQDKFINKILDLEEEVMGSKIVKRLENLGKDLTYEWSLFRSMANNMIDLESNIESIEITGVATNICVLSNAILCQSMLPQAEIYIMDNCVASYDTDLHFKALDIMEGLGINIIGRGNL